MNFKGMFGKEITTGENFVVIRKRSFLFKSYEKKIPISKLKGIDVIKPTFTTSGCIRFVEAGDNRSFQSEKEYVLFAANDENSVIFTSKKDYNFACSLKEVLANKAENLGEVSTDENVEFTARKGKLKFVVLALLVIMISNALLQSFGTKDSDNLSHSEISKNQNEDKPKKKKHAFEVANPYKIVREAGTSKYVAIDSDFVNAEDLKYIGDRIKSDFHSQEPIQVYIFDDEAVAKEWNEYSLKDENDEAKDKHFVALYWKGGVRHDFWIMTEGLNGERETVVYEKREARYHVDLQGVSVKIEDGAFKITNKSGQDLTNVEMLINAGAKGKYYAKTSAIYNGNTLSAGMMKFANRKNELFNPFAIKIKSFSLYSDQGNLWLYVN